MSVEPSRDSVRMNAAVMLNGAASMLYPPDGYAFERPITAGTAEGGPSARLLRSMR